MSCDRITEKCPVCGDEMAIENFQFSDVWKDNKKQRLFVCRHCANKTAKKTKWVHPLDVFDATKKRGGAE